MATTLVILGMALVTFATRFTLVALLSRELPLPVARWLRFVPVAVFAALAAPELLRMGETARLQPEFWAGLAGVLVARRTAQVPLVIAAGLITFWLVRAMGW